MGDKAVHEFLEKLLYNTENFPEAGDHEFFWWYQVKM